MNTIKQVNCRFKNPLFYFFLILTSFLVLSCSKSSDAEPELEAYSLTVSVIPSDGGTVSPSSGTYDEGTEVIIACTPSIGYLFNRWDGDTEGADNPLSIIMDSNKSITGVFEKNPELSYKESIVNLRNRIIEIIRPDGDPSWSYSFDLESDGDLDMILIRSGPSSYPKKEMILFKNQDNKGFEEISTGIDCWGRTVVFDDFNGDGLIDFFVPDHGLDLDPFPGGQDQMIYQTPEGGFIEVTDQVLPALSNFSHGGSSVDLENDGDKDIVVNTGMNQIVLKNENGVWNYWEEGIDPGLENDKLDIGGHPIIDGEIRTDIWEGLVGSHWSRSGDFNNDELEDLILGMGMMDLNDPPDDNGVRYRTIDPYGNILEKGELILFQDPVTGNLIYEYPGSIVENSWRSENITGGLTFGLLVDDFNNDGCLDFVSYGNNSYLHRVEFKNGNCNGEFGNMVFFDVFVPRTGDTLWEDFELVDIDNDGDRDVVLSNSIQWYDTHLIPEEHVVFVNENGQFSQRNGISEELINLPPHVGISWYLDGE